MKSLRPSPRPEPRRTTTNAFIITSMLLSLCILSIIKARYCSAPYVNSQVESVPSHTVKLAQNNIDELPIFEDEDDEAKTSTDNPEKRPAEISVAQRVTTTKTMTPLCYNTTKRSIICDARGDIRLKSSSRTVFIDPSINPTERTTKPYSRHHDPYAMRNVNEWTLVPLQSNAPECSVTHSVPALVFSIGGFTGNLFHDFTDVIVPLFASAFQFRGEVQFVLSDVKPYWVAKFGPILKQLSNYDPIDAGNDGDTVRCFPRAILGLDWQRELSVDPSKTPGNYSMSQLKQVLRDAFGLERRNVAIKSKPRLLIITRKKTRVFLNERGIADMAMSLGFDVRVAEPEITSDLGKFARLVNSADVMIGVHGAGLTNMVFLPDDAVLIQVVPMGQLDWLARDTFQSPAPDLGLKYLDYRIRADESTLSERYPAGHPVLTDPQSIHKKGWYEISRVYLENQDVRPHLGRLRNTLLQALKLLRRYDNSSSNSDVHVHSYAARN